MIIDPQPRPSIEQLSAEYVRNRAGDCLAAFWDAKRRWLQRRRQTLLETFTEACAAQTQANTEFDALDPRLRQAVRATNPGLSGQHWLDLDTTERVGAINAAKYD